MARVVHLRQKAPANGAQADMSAYEAREAAMREAEVEAARWRKLSRMAATDPKGWAEASGNARYEARIKRRERERKSAPPARHPWGYNGAA